MKKVFLSAITLVLSASVFAQRSPMLADDRINGKVKDLREETYFVMVDTAGNETLFLKEESHSVYDKQGRLKQLELFNNNNLPTSKTRYKYGSNGKPSECQTVNLKVKKTQTTTYLYDRNGFLVSDRTRFERGLWSKTVYENSKQGLKVKQTGSNSGNDIVVVWNYKYDDSGNMTESSSDNGFGTLYKYDDKNRLVEESNYTPRGTSNRSEYAYDDFGNVTERKYYDAKDNLIVTMVFEYTYDSKNNWTECATTENGIKSEMKVRKIAYY